MRIGLILVLGILTGCTAQQTLEELEAEAAITGDWSEVEKRERVIARRKARLGAECPNGYISYCESWGGEKRCGCVRRGRMSDILAGR